MIHASPLSNGYTESDASSLIVENTEIGENPLTSLLVIDQGSHEETATVPQVMEQKGSV